MLCLYVHNAHDVSIFIVGFPYGRVPCRRSDRAFEADGRVTPITRRAPLLTCDTAADPAASHCDLLSLAPDL